MMNWQIGKARCRSDEYEAEILATDMGGERPILFRLREKPLMDWAAYTCTPEGRIFDAGPSRLDLLPPRLTLEEAARECVAVYNLSMEIADRSCFGRMAAALQHYEKMKAEGRV